MNKKTAKALLSKLLRQYVKTTKHCRERMAERNVTMDDILHVASRGRVEKLKWDEEHQNWKCEVRGTDIDGYELVLVAVICEREQAALCVTVF